MSKDDFNKAEFLYNISTYHETPMDFPDDVSLSIQNMLAEIREIGYENFHYFSDIKLRTITDPLIMKILLKYYNQMDLFTKNDLMYKINPSKFPEIVRIAKEEFLKLGPTDKMLLNGFQVAMSKATITDPYLDEMFELLEKGEHYAYLYEIRKKLCKKYSHRMLPLLNKHSNGVLLLCVIQDIKYMDLSDDIIEKLKSWANITNQMIRTIQSSESNQELSVTTYEYYRNLCTMERIRTEARLALKKLKVK